MGGSLGVLGLLCVRFGSFRGDQEGRGACGRQQSREGLKAVGTVGSLTVPDRASLLPTRLVCVERGAALSPSVARPRPLACELGAWGGWRYGESPPRGCLFWLSQRQGRALLVWRRGTTR